MSFLQSLWDNPVQLAIPLISAIIGWWTNVVAIQMMFRPLDFVGIRPLLGWQGIIPANALRLANTGLKLVTDKLLDIRELFTAEASQSLLEARREHIEAMTRRLIEETAPKRFPAMWNALAPEVREQVIARATTEVMRLSAEVLGDAADNIGELLHVQRIVSSAVVEDKALMNHIFQSVGAAEFKFIERSGFWFGGLFGLVQLIVWLIYPAWWILPFFGFLVGYATNLVALRLIFDPKEPMKVGPFTFQGLFHQRQKQIAVEFAHVMTRRVLNSDNLFRELATGDSRETLLGYVRARMRQSLDELKKQPMLAMLVAGPAGQALEAEILEEVEAEMFAEGGLVHDFADKSETIRDTLIARMSVMESEAFEDVLRPAFKQDEWKLILAGAALGLVAGIAQLLWLFGDMVLGSGG
ncbi:MAG: hypothetical protein H6744_20125 [Deltaproteobacteria bacterium]|nr:hypothetical protein [Deltaproteobacteria bacterium]